MKLGTRRAAAVLLVALTWSAVAAAQGLYWQSVNSGGPLGDRQMPSETYMMPGRFKHVDESGNKFMIVDMKKQMVYMVDTGEKKYTSMTFDEMEAWMNKAGQKMDKAMAEMEAKLKDMPPEQRAMMEKMMGGMMKKGDKASPVTVKATGEGKTISGMRCTKYLAEQDGQPIMTAWTTTGITEFDAMRKDWEVFSRRLMSMNNRFGGGIGEAFQKIKGFPVQTEIAGITATVTKLERRAIPASEFEVPSGLKKVDNKEFMGGVDMEE